MLDDIGGAVDAARQAVKISPPLARGANGSWIHVAGAAEPVGRARGIRAGHRDLETDNPWARLGLGLAGIRQGKLAEGRGDLELAMALNADSSRSSEATLERPISRKSESRCRRISSSWQSNSIRRTRLHGSTMPSVRRPSTARSKLWAIYSLQSNEITMVRSTVRNSRLNEDLAARGTKLSRIYSDLGFEQLAACLKDGNRSKSTRRTTRRIACWLTIILLFRLTR